MKAEINSELTKDLKAIRNGTILELIQEGTPSQVLIRMIIDPTDNRLVATKFNPQLTHAAAKYFTDYLATTFGGKQYLIVPQAMLNIFDGTGFIADPKAVQSTERVRNTDVTKLAGISASGMQNLRFVVGRELIQSDESTIMQLMLNSGFTKGLVDRYQERGMDGFKLMASSAHCFGLIDGTGKLVAFCRVTDLNPTNIGYLADTLVDDTFFDNNNDLSKVKGTAILYKRVGEYLLANTAIKQLLLIAPPGRVIEFEQNYGCTVPNRENDPVYLARFTPAQPELENVYKELHKDLIASRLAAASFANLFGASPSSPSASTVAGASADQKGTEVRGMFGPG
jgi:hypothetical protein